MRMLSLLLALGLSACLPREGLLPGLGGEAPRLDDFPPDFTPPVSASTGQPMPGFGGGGGGLQRAPVIFVHGNTASARDWLPARQVFLAAGYAPDELWAFTYGRESVHRFDSNDDASVSLGRMVDSVVSYLERKYGRPVLQVDLVAHSLGVTVVRQWMLQTNSFHRVRSVVGVAGANHGVWSGSARARGRNRVAALELAPGSPWLAQLNRAGGAIGGVRYLMLYDGTGWADALFPPPLQDSPALPGARNRPYNRERGTHYGHLELPRAVPVVREMVDFLREAPEADGRALMPRGVRERDTLRAVPEGAQLRCRPDGQHPDRGDPVQREWQLQPEMLLTCFAEDPRSHRRGPVERHRGAGGWRYDGAPVMVRVDPPGGRYAQPQAVHLSAPEGWDLVYTLNGSEPGSGSPRYDGPIVVPGPLRLQARAVAPDGRLSPVRVDDYQIDPRAVPSLQRQLEGLKVEDKPGGR